MDNWNNEDFIDYSGMKSMQPQISQQQPIHSSPSMSRNYVNNNQHQNLVSSNSNSSLDSESLQQIKVGMAKMMSMLERLETRLSKVEQTTTTILKQQQETLSVPFMSQTELDKARQVAEQMEQDTNVAKQLQAAYNKEVEVRKTTTISSRAPTHSMSSYPTPYPTAYPTSSSTSTLHRSTSTSSTSSSVPECPLCGMKVSQSELESHVDHCLDMFSNDPKKASQVNETKKKIETGFFGKFFKTTSTKTETSTKVVSARDNSSPNAPLLGYDRGSINNSNSDNQLMNIPSIYPSFAPYPTTYAPHSPPQFHGNNNSNQPPMMMPMYMYPSYPPMNHQE